MSYTPTEWKTGDVITAEKLNNMESGIVGGQELFIIHATGVAAAPGTSTTPVVDKTYEEIADALQHGKIPFMIADMTQGQMSLSFVIPVTSYSGDPVNFFEFTVTKLASNNSLQRLTITVDQTKCQSSFSIVEIPTT